MPLRRAFSLLSLCAVAVLAKPLQMINGDTLSPSVSDLVDAAFVPNSSTSISAVDTSTMNALITQCDGALYGFNPDIADCQGAAHSIMPDTDQLIWGERHKGLDIDFFPLPFAVFGGKS